MPAIFGLVSISFWQVLVIISLCGFTIQQIWKELATLAMEYKVDYHHGKI